MKYAGDNKYVLEPGEPVTMMCPLCYPEQGKTGSWDRTTFFFCPICGRYYVAGNYVDGFSRDGFSEFCEKHLEHVSLEEHADGEQQRS